MKYFSKKKKLNYYSDGINGIIKNLNNIDVIFDATNSKSNLKHHKILKSKKKLFINLTPSKIGKFYIPYIDNTKKLKSKTFHNLYEIYKEKTYFKYKYIKSLKSQRKSMKNQ